MHNHGAHINTRLHRPSVMPDECADEGHNINERQGRGPIPKEDLAPKAERMRVAKFWRVSLVSAAAVFCFLLLIHWGAQ